VAGGVTDGKEDGLIFFSGLLKGSLTPGIPVDRIMSVLKEVRAFLAYEGICIFMVV